MTARRWARRIEGCCCTFATYIPLIFVYGLTSWALWVIVTIGSTSTTVPSWLGTESSAFGVLLYGLLNWSYTTAVFTDPGSTTNVHGYSSLPTQANPVTTSLTVKSNGELRFCKKCQARKPDRAHHCSTCRRCVLKMDHHCPWLATCIGLRNHKAFLLFLIYVTLFCWYAFAVSGTWVWREVIDSTAQYLDTFTPVNFIILSVVSGIIGLVVGAFTGWHIMLASRGQTTIECLEKTRYLSPLKKQFVAQHRGQGIQLPRYGQQLLDIHANAIPGVTRPEEGEERSSPRPSGHEDDGMPVRLSYAEHERARSRRRYDEYLDEQDSGKLPNAFDLGAKRNLLHLFGPNPLLWAVPISNTTGDGWSWEPSPKWLEARERIRVEREEQRAREIQAGWGGDESPAWLRSPANPAPTDGAGRHYLPSPGTSPAGVAGRRTPSKADRILGRDPNLYADEPADAVSMSTLSSHGKALTDDELLRDDDNEEVENDPPRTQSRGTYEAAQATMGNRPPETAQDRADAEHRAMNLVTNGGWSRSGGARGLLRKQPGGSPRVPSPTDAQPGDDDAVD